MFQRLRRLHAFIGKHFPDVQSSVDSLLITEIGYFQERGRPLTVKGLLLLNLGAPATVRRHLQKLINLELVHKHPATYDRRICHLEIDRALRTECAKLLKLILRL